MAEAFVAQNPDCLQPNYSAQIRLKSGSSRPTKHPAEILALGSSYAPTVAAQTRIASAAGIRLDHRKSVRPFKGIFCNNISEFESYMPSHAVASRHGHSGPRSPRGRTRQLPS